MKRVAFLLIFIVIFCSGFSQQLNIPMDMTAADSFYTWSNFRANGTVLVTMNYTGVSTDSIEANFYYMLKDRYTDEYIPIQIELTAESYLPITLSTTNMIIANGDTTNMEGFKINNFLGDRLGIKLTKHDAVATDTVKIMVRK